MRELGHVCLGCRARLVQTAASRAAPAGIARPRALVHNISLKGYSTTSVLPSQQDGPPTSRSRPAWQVQAGSTPSPSPTAAAKSSRSATMAIFNTVVGQKSAPELLDDELKNTIPFEHLSELVSLLKKEADVATISACYDRVIPPGTPKHAIPGTIRDTPLSERFIRRLAKAKAQDFISAELPSVTRLMQISMDLGHLNVHSWSLLILKMNLTIFQISTSPEDYSSTGRLEDAMARRDALLIDLVGSWNIFTNTKGHHVPEHPFRSNVPPFHLVFTRMHPRAIAHRHRGDELKLLPLAAYVTYVLLGSSVNAGPSIADTAGPFLGMMKKVLSWSTPNDKDVQDMCEKHSKLYEHVTAGVAKMKAEEPRGSVANPDIAKLASTKAAPDGSITRPVIPHDDRRHKMAEMIHWRIGQAIKGRNLGALMKTWEDFLCIPDDQKTPDVLNYFILAFMGMRQQQRAIDVWNYTEMIGVKPTIKTWNSMILGCSVAKNADGIEVVWKKLISSGIKLDAAIWTTRVDGLISAGKPEAGLRALNEMAQVWLERNKPGGSGQDAVQPTVEPINAAVNGLMRLGKIADCYKVLAWAGKHKIDPDIFTFNTLLRPLVRQGQTEQVTAVLKMMSGMGIEPTTATFTIMLEGVLANLDSTCPEQQVALVTKIIEDMEAAGVVANMMTFSKMIYILLQEGGGSLEAVNAVLATIRSRGWELNSHIYTMLAEHHFARDPPEPEAVAALIRNHGLVANKAIDRVFWERVVKGYCQVGRTEEALAIFNRVFASGTTMSLSTLYEFLLALIRDGQMQQAAKLVESLGTMNEAADRNREGGSREWKHRFWHLADQYGLMDATLLARFREAIGQHG
ncbi:glutathione S-transferase-like protein [Podospora didyma]|uniref:Glutathione S-transferase-like protein n=1 Tax=Podospora didyma TaxID=330526 RepID=A0AAE0KFL7_9PEZI|nr:glutathione S-transferase-like protein [Podospora didyma]